MQVQTGLTEQQRSSMVARLSALLADEFVLYTKARNYHWNVVGLQFPEYHAFFEKLYEELNQAVDDMAERIRSLGGWAPGTLDEFLKSTRLSERPGRDMSVREMVRDLHAGYEGIIRYLREDINAADSANDAGTNNFLSGLLEAHEKTAWMLRASLEANGRS